MAVSFEHISNEMVTLEVGSAKTAFVVHKDLLTKSSPYFEAMLTGNWKESSGGVIPLPAANPAIMPSVLNWLYSGYLCEANGDDAALGGNECTNCGGKCAALQQKKDDRPKYIGLERLSSTEDEYLENLLNDITKDDIHMYFFADQYDIPALREALINRKWYYIVNDEGFPTYGTAINCFRHLNTSSPMCRLLMDAYVDLWRARQDNECPIERQLRSKLPLSMTFMLAAGLAEKARNPGRGRIGALCDYHEHAEGEDARKTCAESMKSAAFGRRIEAADWKELEKRRAAARGTT